jgi:hypothetical protein
MNMVAQLLMRQHPPLPPICNPGRHGVTYRHGFCQGVEDKAVRNSGRNPIAQERMDKNRVLALKAVLKGASSIPKIADSLGVKNTTAYDYVLWLESTGLCTIDRGKRPFLITPAKY